MQEWVHLLHTNSPTVHHTDDSHCSPTVSMLWNWYTVDSCFLSSTWHVRSKAQFAGSVIGVCLLVMAIEGVRRLGREYDRRLLRTRNDAIENATCGMGAGAGLVAASVPLVPAVKPTSTGGCGSKAGGCGSKKTSTPSMGGEISACGTPSKDLETPSAELGGFKTATTGSGFSQMHCRPPVPSLPTWTQQLLRSFIYGSQFSAAFLV